MSNENKPNRDIERLKSLLGRLSMTQIRFIVARVESKSDKEAAETIGISPSTVKAWNSTGEKQIIDETVEAMRFDGLVTALEIRRRNLAKAMAVKVSALDLDDDRIKQSAATEIIEWELGKAAQKQEFSGPDGGAIPIDLFSAALKRVYDDGDSRD